jgi:hypothetical protein
VRVCRVTLVRIAKAGDQKPSQLPRTKEEAWPPAPLKTYRLLYPSFPNKCAILNSHAKVCGVTL